MAPASPQFGFDRFIPMEWIQDVLRVCSGQAEIDELDARLQQAGLGDEARAKSRTKLNAFGLRPRHDLADFISRGVRIFSSRPKAPVCFAWGAAITAYPYFGKVAEITGRLTLLHGDCAVAEIHRRMAEIYGDRQITKRASQAVLQSQVNWGTVLRTHQGKRLARAARLNAGDNESSEWLLEAFVRYYGKPMSLAAIGASAVAYPFEFAVSLPLIISKSQTLELRADSASNQFVGLKSVA